jgi:hypothetical protein
MSPRGLNFLAFGLIALAIGLLAIAVFGGGAALLSFAREFQTLLASLIALATAAAIYSAAMLQVRASREAEASNRRARTMAGANILEAGCLEIIDSAAAIAQSNAVQKPNLPIPAAFLDLEIMSTQPPPICRRVNNLIVAANEAAAVNRTTQPNRYVAAAVAAGQQAEELTTMLQEIVEAWGKVTWQGRSA